MIKRNKKGLTMVEVLLVVAILLIMIGIMTGTLNPLALINRGKDARRKKDIARIKIAMEEHMNDKGYYPFGDLLASLNNEDNCGEVVFSPWLSPWPCDPNGQSYILVVEGDTATPSWFKVYANLENKNDKDIPDWWYDGSSGSYYVGDGSLGNTDVNFGTSSTNVFWYERTFDDYCLEGGGGYTGVCYRKKSGQPCNDCGAGCEAGDGYSCFLDSTCERCQVSCCENGQLCD